MQTAVHSAAVRSNPAMTETPLAGLPAAESFTLLDLIPIDELQHVQDSLAAATGES